MTKKGRRSYHHGNLRRALMDAALRFLARQGMSKLSMQALAREAGVSSGAPYHHFANKEEVLAALAEDGFRILADAMETSDHTSVDDLGRAYLAFAKAHPVHFELMFLKQWSERDRFPALHQQADRALATLRRTVTVAAEGDETMLLSRSVAVFAAIHGLAVLSNADVVQNVPGVGDPLSLTTDVLRLVNLMLLA